jgi:hypothetical protein
MTPKELTEPAFHAIAYHRIPNSLADSKSETPWVFPTLIGIHCKVCRPQPFAVAVAARIFGPSTQTLMFAQVLVHRASYA